MDEIKHYLDNRVVKGFNVIQAVVSGGCGVTYGQRSVFLFYSPGDKRENFADQYWNSALDQPGAFQAA